MKLNTLFYGNYKEYHSGDGSRYDHYTAYQRAKAVFAIFSQDDSFYYNLLENSKPYEKVFKYGETSITIEGPLVDILAYGVDSDEDYSLDDILLLMPTKLVRELPVLPDKNRVLQLL